jgi:type II secretory pathway pseudopilin PulG
MNPRREQGWTTGETVIAVLVFGILALFIVPLPSLIPQRGRSQVTQTLSNMKQLHLATQIMALDGVTNGDTNLGWPGDTGGSFSHWATMLTKNNGYLTTNDLCKLLSGPGKVTPLNRLPVANTNAVLVYAVGDESPGDAVFLTTANFTNSPTGGSPLLTNAKPYGNKNFVIFQKGADAKILLPRQVGETKSIGSYVPLCQ